MRTMVATKGWALFGTRVRRLRMKCVRHRCQAVPGSSASIALVSPLWSSEITSCTPERPRSTRPARKTRQAASSRCSPGRGTPRRSWR